MAKKALCIGINDYPGTESDLSGCLNDAHDWAGILEARQFEVRKLLDAQATKAAMKRAIGDLIAGAAPDDTLVITYSGPRIPRSWGRPRRVVSGFSSDPKTLGP
jgi:metacaspase-1